MRGFKDFICAVNVFNKQFATNSCVPECSAYQGILSNICLSLSVYSSICDEKLKVEGSFKWISQKINSCLRRLGSFNLNETDIDINFHRRIV